MRTTFRLQGRVKAVNRANDYANKLYVALRAIFEPLVGQQVTKKDGTLLAKIQKLMPELPSTHNLHVYRYSSEYSLVWVVKTSEPDDGSDGSGPHTVTYHETSVYVADLKSGVVGRIYDPPNFRTDYKLEDVLALRAKYEQAKKLADDARSALHPFGEYDR